MRNYNQNFRIEIPCPQCGAPIEVEETDHVLFCNYCRTKVILLASDYFRYYIPPVDSHQDFFYVPYWRLNGLYYSIDSTGFNDKIIDITILAHQIQHLPYSLGVRPQAIKLKPIFPGMSGKFLKPEIPFNKVIEKIGTMMNTTHILKEKLFDSQVGESRENWDEESILMDYLKNFGNSVFLTQFIGETISMIYFPVFVKNKMLYDGILNSPLSPPLYTYSDFDNLLQTVPHWELGTLPLMCPNCGWDITGTNDSIVFFCKNCSNSWLFFKNKLRKCSVDIAVSQNSEAIYLPFWKIKIAAKGLIEQKFEHQIKRTFLIKSNLSEEETLETVFWTPAFKLLPSVYLQTAQNVTNYNPELKLSKDYFENDRLFPITLPFNEAFQSIRLIIAKMAESKINVFPHVAKLKIEAKQAVIVYLPFIQEGIDLLQPDMKFSIIYSAIRGKSHLDNIIKL